MKVEREPGGVTQVADLARVFAEGREGLSARACELGGVGFTRAYSDLTDELVRSICEIAVDDATASFAEARKAAFTHALVAAVGGYGRREMAPFSDIDVTFITDGVEDEALDQVVKRAFKTLMDLVEDAGLTLGYSYRHIEDVADLPLDTQTAMLDARLVTGSESLFTAFGTELRNRIVPFVFVSGHARQRDSGATPFAAQPDLKEGCGCLRDLHVARWLSDIAFGVRSNHWSSLRARGFLTDSDIAGLEAAEEFLLKARCTLHLIAGRPVDVLSRERQAEVASELGFRGPQELMAEFYSHAHQVKTTCGAIVDACLDSHLVIEPGVTARAGRVCVVDHSLFSRDPSTLIRLFKHAGSYGLKFSREAAEAVRSSAPSPQEQNYSFRAAFLDILSCPRASSALRSMADLGLLQAILPKFGELMYLVPGDEAHQCTVGEHSLKTVEELEKLPDEDDERFADAFGRVERPEVLTIAALLHDIGKLDAGQNHSRTGAARAVRLAREAGLPEDAAKQVEFLVRHHLRMAEVARLRDLNQPRTVADFVAVVDDPRLLDMLFLLTAADLRAVGTVNWTRVQMRFLVELHERALAALRSPASARPDIERHRRRVRRELSLANIPHQEIDEHCELMPASYLLNTPPEELAAHIGYVRSVRQGKPVVEIKDDRTGGFSILTVVALDKAGLLSEIAGVLYALGIDIRAAQIFTRASRNRIAIDVLYTDSNGRQLSETVKWQLEGSLTDVLTGAVPLGELLQRMGKRPCPPPGEISLRVLEGVSDHHTVIEIKAPDVPGLLHCLTRTISESGMDIRSARIATWGSQAHDVFYLSGPGANPAIAELRDRLGIEDHGSRKRGKEK